MRRLWIGGVGLLNLPLSFLTPLSLHSNMQVTSLFATLFGFLSLVAPLTTLALQITAPTTLRLLEIEDSDPSGPLTFYLAKNGTLEVITSGVDPAAGSVVAALPTNVSGDGWTVQATTPSSNVPFGSSAPIFITAASTPQSTKGMSNAGVVVGGVAAAIVALALLVLGAFIYARRRRRQPVFSVEAPPQHSQQHSRSFSSTNTVTANDAGMSLELDKVQWEMALEAQFARARAGTPDRHTPNTSY
ncbi:hypothetical protein B0H10DRAFT_2032887 [Mycena sp. CBHHK59/15]|nr:hypothetical protein B0H10DRAFT_2032887 [Mycena sp. CBHHK59/15]